MQLVAFGAGSAIGDPTSVFLGDRGLEGGPESRGPFWRERPVYWGVTVGTCAPGKV